MENTIKTIIIAFVPILGIWIAYLLNKSSKLKEQINIDKRKIYLKFIDILKNVLLATKRKEDFDENVIEKEMMEFIFNSIFWAPKEVLKAISEMQKIGRNPSSNNNPLQIIKKNFEVILAMRKDLGLSNKGLDWKILAQMLLEDDIDKLLSKNNNY